LTSVSRDSVAGGLTETFPHGATSALAQGDEILLLFDFLFLFLDGEKAGRLAVATVSDLVDTIMGSRKMMGVPTLF